MPLILTAIGGEWRAWRAEGWLSFVPAGQWIPAVAGMTKREKVWDFGAINSHRPWRGVASVNEPRGGKKKDSINLSHPLSPRCVDIPRQWRWTFKKAQIFVRPDKGGGNFKKYKFFQKKLSFPRRWESVVSLQFFICPCGAMDTRRRGYDEERKRGYDRVDFFETLKEP